MEISKLLFFVKELMMKRMWEQEMQFPPSNEFKDNSVSNSVTFINMYIKRRKKIQK